MALSAPLLKVNFQVPVMGMETQMETTILYWGYIGIMEKKMETTILYWGYIGIIEKKMETTILDWGYMNSLKGQGPRVLANCQGAKSRIETLKLKR